MLCLVLIKTGNAPIPTMKIRQIEYSSGFLNSTLWKIRCSFNPKAQAVNKAQRQLRLEPYFPEFLNRGLRMTVDPDLDYARFGLTSEQVGVPSWLSPVSGA